MSKIIVKCKRCQIDFYVNNYSIKKGHGKFCSRFCAREYSKKPFYERLWDKIEVKGKNDCWPFKKYLNSSGYGVITGNNDKKYLAHRVAYMSKYGEFPENMNVLHTCDNPMCCNPSHLRLGTQKDNVIDMISKGRCRYVKGENQHKSKLTEVDVIFIRESYNGGNVKELAIKFGVTATNILFIIKRKSWKHVQ